MVQLRSYLKAAAPGLVAIALVWSLFDWWTLNYTAFTSYSYVVQAAAPFPKVPPAFQLTDQKGQKLLFSNMKGKYRLVTFGYVSCGGTCPITMGEFQHIAEQLQEQRQVKVTLLTITLDPSRDTRDLLRQVWQGYGASDLWSLATPGVKTNRELYWAKLRGMGMWVDQDQAGQPIHDNRTFLIDPQGLLVRSFAGVPTVKELNTVMKGGQG